MQTFILQTLIRVKQNRRWCKTAHECPVVTRWTVYYYRLPLYYYY